MFKIGIIGAGWIAQKMAKTLAPLQDYCVHAVASRSREKAEAFANTWNITKAYGSYEKPSDMVTGYEYQVIESRRCIEAGLLESPMMPHEETVSIMRQMDGLRKEWGVRYPMD